MLVRVSQAPTILGGVNSPEAPPAGFGLRWRVWQPWLSLLVRLGMAGILAAAAAPKLADLTDAQLRVAAYELFPTWLNQLIGVALPIVELSLAVLLLSGLLSRYAAFAFGLMMLVFIAGIISAWARGLNIDCGCFTPPGVGLAPGEQAEYGKEVLRDLGFLALAGFLAVWPRSKFSLDGALRLDPIPKHHTIED